MCADGNTWLFALIVYTVRLWDTNFVLSKDPCIRRVYQQGRKSTENKTKEEIPLIHFSTAKCILNSLL